MGKFFFWTLVVCLIVMFLRRQGALARARREMQQRPAGTAGPGGFAGRAGSARGNSADDLATSQNPDVMMSCAVCGVHMPASEAIFAHGHVFCCEEHLAQGRNLRAGQRFE